MFYTIHRAIKLLLLCCVGAVAWKIYEQRETFEPAYIWVHVWDNGGFNVPQAETTGGRVVQVVNSQTFVMSPRIGVRFNVRLLGLREPSKEVTVEAAARENKRKKALEELIMGKWVTLELNYRNANSLGGVAFVQGTNINAHLVHQGLAFSSKEILKGMPRDTQYSLLWASRHRVTSR